MNRRDLFKKAIPAIAAIPVIGLTAAMKLARGDDLEKIEPGRQTIYIVDPYMVRFDGDAAAILKASPDAVIIRKRRSQWGKGLAIQRVG